MNSSSLERASLVHERCLTCGALLPCALHDREMKMGMLEEREEMPLFRKTWEAVLKPEVKHTLQLTDHGWLYVENGGVYFLGKDLSTLETDKHSCVLNSLKNVKMFVKVDDSFIVWTNLIFESEGNPLVMGDEIYWDHTHDEWRSRPFRVTDAPVETEIRFTSEISSNKEEFPWTFLRHYYSGLILAKLRTSIKDGVQIYSLETVPYSSYDFPSHETPYIFSQNDGSVLIFEESLAQYDPQGRILRPVVGRSSDESSAWRFEGFEAFYFEASARSEILRLTDNKFLVCVGSEVRIIERNSRTGKFKESVLMENDENYGRSDEKSFVGMFSSESFVVVLKDEIVFIEEKSEGVWSQRKIKTKTDPISRLVVESPTKFDLFFIDGHVEHWEIPEHELRAWHERQISQTNLPPLPSDI